MYHLWAWPAGRHNILALRTNGPLLISPSTFSNPVRAESWPNWVAGPGHSPAAPVLSSTLPYHFMCSLPPMSSPAAGLHNFTLSFVRTKRFTLTKVKHVRCNAFFLLCDSVEFLWIAKNLISLQKMNCSFAHFPGRHLIVTICLQFPRSRSGSSLSKLLLVTLTTEELFECRNHSKWESSFIHTRPSAHANALSALP